MTEDTHPVEPKPTIPHHKTVAVVSGFVLIAFASVTGYVLVEINDDTIRGAVIGAWSAMATGASAFWLGSSSGGKLNR